MSSRSTTSSPQYWEKGHLSYSGGAYLGIYNIGAALAFQQFAPHISSRKSLGASSGAIVSMTLSTGIPMCHVVESFVRLATHCREKTLGFLDPCFNLAAIIREDMQRFVPENGHKMASDKCFVSLTDIEKLKNVILSDFASREELFDTIIASCFIPFFFGLFPPKIRGVRYIDGGASNNLIIHDENTITVSPFSGKGKIRPRNTSASLPDTFFCLANVKRLAQALYAPSPKILEGIFTSGYEDALQFIRNEDLFACADCAQLPSRPRRGECVVCEALLKLSYEAKIHPQLLKFLRDAQLKEDALFKAHPYRYSMFGNILCVLLALLFLPINVTIAVALKKYNSKD